MHNLHWCRKQQACLPSSKTSNYCKHVSMPLHCLPELCPGFACLIQVHIPSVTLTKLLSRTAGLPVPVSDDSMDTDAPAASETPATAEASTSAVVPSEPNQDVEMAGEEQAATSTPPAAEQPSIKKAPVDPDAASYLPECITHTARLLESMFSNHDTCSKFVQQGGVEVLLQLYRLPKLPPTFGSSSASHSLLAMFRSLTAHNSSDISSKLQPSLSSQFMITLELAEVRQSSPCSIYCPKAGIDPATACCSAPASCSGTHRLHLPARALLCKCSEDQHRTCVLT